MVLDLLALVAGADPAGGPDAAVGELFVYRLVAAGLTDEEEVRAELGDEGAEGLAAVQIVAEQDRPVGEQSGDVGGQPALGSVALAILLALVFGPVGPVGGGVVLGLHEQRQEREDAVVAVGDDGGREHGMEELLGFVLADMARRALLAMDGVRAMELDSVEGDEEAAVEAQEGLEAPLVADGVEAEGEEVGEEGGVETVEQIPNLIVTRDLADAEEGVAVGAGRLLVHAALEVEEGGGLEEERGEGAGRGIGDGVALVGAGTGVGQGGGGLLEAVQKGLEHSGIGNGGHTLCLKAVPAKSSPQKLVPCYRPLSGSRDKKGQIENCCGH